MKKCPYCGTLNQDDATACEKCYGGLPVKESEEKPKEQKKSAKGKE